LLHSKRDKASPKSTEKGKIRIGGLIRAFDYLPK